MKKICLATTILICSATVFHGQIAIFKAKQNSRDNSKKKAVKLNSPQRSDIRTFDLRVISAVNGGNVFIGGHGTSIEGEKIRGYGLLVKISGGGDVTFKELPFLSDIQDIFFVDNLTGWVLGYGGTYKTVDGGNTWKKSGISGDAIGPLFFLDAGNGWYFSKDNVLKRVQGNQIEALKSFENFPYVKKLQFTSSLRGWLMDVVAGQSRFLHTDDGGKNWSAVNIVGETGVYDFQFINDYDGFAVTSGGLYYTNDSGENWKLVKKQTKDNRFSRLFFKDRNTGWIIGQKDCFTGNGGITWKCGEPQKEIENTIIRGVVFTDFGNGWLLTDKGLYFSENNDAVWKRKMLSFGDTSF